MKFKIGSGKGNSRALLRWGTHLDNGIWYRSWNFRSLWLKWRFQPGYLDFGVFCIHYGN